MEHCNKPAPPEDHVQIVVTDQGTPSAPFVYYRGRRVRIRVITITVTTKTHTVATEKLSKVQEYKRRELRRIRAGKNMSANAKILLSLLQRSQTPLISLF